MTQKTSCTFIFGKRKTGQLFVESNDLGAPSSPERDAQESFTNAVVAGAQAIPKDTAFSGVLLLSKQLAAVRQVSSADGKEVAPTDEAQVLVDHFIQVAGNHRVAFMFVPQQAAPEEAVA